MPPKKDKETGNIIKELRRRVPEVRSNFLTYLETDRQRFYQNQVQQQQEALRRVESSNWSAPKKQRAILHINTNLGKAKALLEQASSKKQRKADMIKAFETFPGRFFWDDQPPPPSGGVGGAGGGIAT